MTYDIYADVVLLNNFTMDFLLLSLVKEVMNLEKRKGGILLASLAGAVYALAVMIVPFPVFFLQMFITYAGVSTLMAAVAFKIRNRRELVKAVAGLYLAAVITAGLMEQFRAFGWFSQGYLYAAAAGVSGYLALVLWKTVSQRAVLNSHLYAVTLVYQERRISYTGFLDTGNRLTEPFSGKPVSIISAAGGRELFETVNAVLYIPFRCVGKEDGVLPAVKADRMEITGNGETRVVEAPYIAISKESLSQDDTYQILLNEKLWS